MFATVAPSGAPVELLDRLNPLVEAAISRAHQRAEHDPAGLGRAIADLEQLAAIHNDRRAGAWAWHHRGRAHLLAARVDPALLALTEALAAFVDVGDSLGAARTRAFLGVGFSQGGASATGLDRLHEALETQRVIGDTWGEARTLELYGQALAHIGRHDEALVASSEAHALFERLGDTIQATVARVNQGHALNGRARTMAESGDGEAAARIYDENVRRFSEACAVAHRARHERLLAQSLLGLGNARAGLGDHDDAATHLLESARLGRAAGDEILAASADLDRSRSVLVSEGTDAALSLLAHLGGSEQLPPCVRAEAARLSADIHEGLGRVEVAYRSFRRFHELQLEARGAHAIVEAAAATARLDTTRLRLEARTAQLAVDRLEADAEDRSRLIAAVAHELRTPLTAVNGFAAALVAQWDDWDPEQLKETVGVIAQQAMDASNIVEDLLTAAGVSRGTLQVIATVIDVERTIRGECSGLTVSVADDVGPAHADSFRVRQIVRNLISNARRYGGSHICVSIGRVGPRVFVEVIDDGDGVPTADEERVFEPFARADRAEAVATSMGLGLPISRELARLMGGDLTYRRQTGATVFRLELPGAVEGGVDPWN